MKKEGQYEKAETVFKMSLRLNITSGGLDIEKVRPGYNFGRKWGKCVCVMLKEEGQYFCSPISALPICLPNSESYDHSAILATLGHAHITTIVISKEC